MKTIAGESFQIQLEESDATVCFKGALRLSGTDEYASILDMLRGTLEGDRQKSVTVDVRELEFLNSSGITMLSRFVIEAREQMDVNLSFVVSERVAWHSRSLKNLQRLMPALGVRSA